MEKLFTGVHLDDRDKATAATDSMFPVPNHSKTVSDDLTLTIPILDQKLIPNCLGYSIVRQMKEYWFLKTGRMINFSPRFIYAKAVRPDTTGLYPGDAYDVVTNFGCPTAMTCPELNDLSETEYRNMEITQEMLDEAKQYAMPGAIDIPPDMDAIRAAIPHVCGVGATFEVGDFGNEIIQPPRWANPSLHRMEIGRVAPCADLHGILDGLPDYIAMLPNNWGAYWGMKGIGFLFWSAWKGKIHDVKAFPRPNRVQ